MKPTKHNTFCYFPFQQITLKNWFKHKGILGASPCCNLDNEIDCDPLGILKHLKKENDKPTAKQIFHSKPMQELRQSMLDNKQHPACNLCWKMEAKNPDNPASYRLYSTPVAEHSIDNPQLRSIDFGLGEECNLRCRMCIPALSNQLRKDQQYFVENNLDITGIQGFESVRTKSADQTAYDYKTVKHFDQGSQWQDILQNISDLREIKASGGETTITEPFNQLIDRAISTDTAKNIDLSFHTNCTKFTNKLVSKLAKFKNISIECSIDSTDKNYEYIRYPMPWNKLRSSLENLLSATDVEISNINFNVVMTSLNAFHMHSLWLYQQSLWKKYKHIKYYNFFIDMVRPENKFTNVKFLTPDLKQQLIDLYMSIQANGTQYTLDKFGNSYCDLDPKLQASIDYLQSCLDYQPSDQDRKNMLREITVFDQSRGQHYKDYLDPRIIKYLETPL